MTEGTISVKLLYSLAAASVLFLLIASDFSPQEVQGFSNAQISDKEVQVRCVVLSCNESSKGYVFNLLDTQGMQVEAFCSKDISEVMPSIGCIVDVICQPSKTDKNFFFIKSLQLVQPEVGLIIAVPLRAACSWP